MLPAMASKDGPEKSPGRLKQIVAAYRMTAKADPGIRWLLPLVFLGVLAVAVTGGVLLDYPVYGSILGVMFAVMATMIVFGRRAERAAYAQVEGQMGAAAAVLNSMRGNWVVMPGVAFNRNQDLVHVAVGKPGVVLVGEGGSTARVLGLIANQRKRIAKVAGEDVPLHEVVAGNGEAQVPLRKLQARLVRLGRNLKRHEIAAVAGRIRAMAALNQPPLPKGPMPRNAKMARGKQR